MSLTPQKLDSIQFFEASILMTFPGKHSLATIYMSKIKRHLLLGRKVMTNLDSKHIKKQRYYFVNKGPSSQGYGFFSS